MDLVEAKNNLKQLIKMFSSFNENDLDEVIRCFHPRSIKKNSILLSEGETSREFYFIYKGCIRTYFISKQGHEKTRYIMIEPSIGTALTSFISQKTSFEFIDVLEDSELLVISRNDFYKLTETIPAWKDFYLKIMEMAYSFQTAKIESLVTLSAKQRYEQLLKAQPKLIQRLSNKVLASYLDVTQETLSRLKSK